MADTANIKATISTLVPKGTPSPLRLSSPQIIQQSKQLPPELQTKLSQDLQSIQQTVNSLHSTAQESQGVSQLLLTNSAGQVVAAFGTLTFEGVQYVNFLSELHVGDFTLSGDPTKAVFNANVDGEVSIGNNGWFDVHDPYGGNAAWIGTQNDTQVITNAVRSPNNEVRLTVTGTTLITGNTVAVRNMNLYNVPNANGDQWTVTKVDANTVDLQGSVWSGPFTPLQNPPAGLTTYQPTIDRVLQIDAITNHSGLFEIRTTVPHTYTSGDRVAILTAPGMPTAVGQWTIKVIDSTHFTLTGSTFAGSLASNGTCLRYFAGLLAQTIAIGQSFQNFNLREFADGSLVINNATITVNSVNGSIVIDPSVPSIVLTSSTGTTITLDASNGSIIMMNAGGAKVVLDASNGSIILTPPTTLAKIVIDSTVPDIVLYDAAGAISVDINANTGAISASSVAQTGAFTGTANVRNAAGTGVSSFTFSGGICTGFTP